MTEPSPRPYRACVAAFLFNAQGQLFIGERRDLAGVWQVPQGGIDAGETPEQALVRELREEIGTDRIVVLGRAPQTLCYDFPPGLPGTPFRGRYRGQEQTWFAAQLDGPDSLIDLTRHPPIEFRRWRWVPFGDLLTWCEGFKQPVYRQAMTVFQPLVAERFGIQAVQWRPANQPDAT